MIYVHGLAIPESQEEEFIVKAKNIENRLQHYDFWKEEQKWSDLQSQLNESYVHLPESLRDKYFARYEKLTKEMCSRQKVKNLELVLVD